MSTSYFFRRSSELFQNAQTWCIIHHDRRKAYQKFRPENGRPWHKASLIRRYDVTMKFAHSNGSTNSLYGNVDEADRK